MGMYLCIPLMSLVAYSEENSQLSGRSVITSSTDNVASGSHTLDKASSPDSMNPGNNLSDQAVEAALSKPKYR